METDAARARGYEKALEAIWSLTRGKSGETSRAERDIAAVALGLGAPGTHLRGIDHLAPPKSPSPPGASQERQADGEGMGAHGPNDQAVALYPQEPRYAALPARARQ